MLTSSKDPLKILSVIDRLEIGPVRLERNRLIAPYNVILGSRRDTTNLIYRYGEDVFAPESLESQNLASVIAAQVALNYGLFCKEIVFHGPFDKYDQQFIREMAEKTAQEIYVVKFLKYNPFLLGEAAHLPAIKQDSYLRAKIIFKDDKINSGVRSPNLTPLNGAVRIGVLTARNLSINKSLKTNWDSDSSHYAVLSSGGKDSLLSFGLLNELGYRADAIYVNESGRHWYTALNAYHYFERHIPRTARVWTNADRLFNWMLRHLPFVRQDFARFRADEYPIRLWTVAVFIFGALPLLRKRGLGRLIIGDEYDTTRKMYHNGILHYDGLYDQSRYFNKAMSSYYKHKGWGISQFSLLRPLSELMIQKILVERYPDLQRQQVSCHATHIERGRVYPCGGCEKCRRIVGMLLALGADPIRCGYKRTQIKSILKDLASTTLRQDAATSGQMLYLLSQKGILEIGDKIKPHPQVMKLMIDNDKSPISDIPDDLRAKLFAIYLKHADGVTKKQGKKWV
ncbi:MAG TPA: hypothetical protein DCZ43_07430 [candidate division Zixibacteria bacterium]|nr:hypothetical protein [candidate division Zixibacteria bacterium]